VNAEAFQFSQGNPAAVVGPDQAAADAALATGLPLTMEAAALCRGRRSSLRSHRNAGPFAITGTSSHAPQ